MKQTALPIPAPGSRRLFCALLALTLAAVTGAALVSQSSPSPPGEDMSVLSPTASGEMASEDPSSVIGGRGSSIINILLIGQDRSEEETTARSDSMILCTFNKQTRRLTMTSFLRDLYVRIPGHGSNRINAAYAFGGIELLDRTLEDNFGLHIDGNIEVDFSQFADIVDLLGGVELSLRSDEAAYINQKTGSTLEAGSQLLNGQQALAYSRIRKLDADGDFGRTMRQRRVMNAILDTYRSAKLSTILALMDDILPLISTDLNTLEIVRYAMELFPLLSDTEVVSQRIPADGTYQNRTIDGMSVLTADMESAREMLAEALLPD